MRGVEEQLTRATDDNFDNIALEGSRSRGRAVGI